MTAEETNCFSPLSIHIIIMFVRMEVPSMTEKPGRVIAPFIRVILEEDVIKRILNSSVLLYQFI